MKKLKSESVPSRDDTEREIIEQSHAFSPTRGHWLGMYEPDLYPDDVLPESSGSFRCRSCVVLLRR